MAAASHYFLEGGVFKKFGHPLSDVLIQAGQADPRITLQKLPRLKAGFLSASTSALTLPNVVSGLC
ncbi:MAG: hypothetical protein QOH31_6160, partial [Verrucomicrobiota bacterium]